MRNKRILNLAIASALGLSAPVTVGAFGLGKIEIQSALNEPFRAQIPVTALKIDEADNLQVRLASVSEFEKAGLERNFILSDFSFEIVKNSATDVVINVSSIKSVREPLLDFLLTASAGNGRLIREYTVLLDPPKHILVDPPVMRLGPVSSSVINKPEKTVLPPKAKQEVSSELISSPHNISDYGVTTSSDTLWNIAKKVLPNKNVSMNQMMIALRNANPDAFMNNNINGLKKGYAIKVPSETEITSISKQKANELVKQQNQAWTNRNKPISKAGSVSSSVVDSLSYEDEEASSETTKLNDISAIPATESTTKNDGESKLSLVTPSQGEPLTKNADSQIGDEKLKSLSEQLTFAQETIEAQAQQTIEIESRMAAMEEQLETMRRLISLKDADLARLQSLLEEEQQDDASFDEKLETVVEAAIEGAEDIAEELETAIDDSTDTAEVSEQTSEQLDDESAPLQEQPATETQELDTTVTEAPIAAVAEQPQQLNKVVETIVDVTGADPELTGGLVQQVTEFTNKNKVPLSLAGVLLLVILLLLFRRKKSDDGEEAAEPQVVVPVAAENEQEETSEETTREVAEEKTTEVSVKTAEDLIEQADVFVGYADYAQARTSLEQARFIEPDNSQAVSKLLFVLFKQQQADKFIQLIEETGVDSSHTEWQQIEEWGKQLAPDYELFADTAVVEDETVFDSNEVEADDSLEIDAAAEPSTESINSDSEQEESYLDFNADDYQVEQEITSSEDSVSTEFEEESLTLDENLDTDNDEFSIDFNDTNELVEPEISVDSTESADDNADDIDLSLDIDSEIDAGETELTIDVDDAVVEQTDNVDEQELSIDLDAEPSLPNDDTFDIEIDDSAQGDDSETSELSLDDSLSFEIDQLDQQDGEQLDSDAVEEDLTSELDFDTNEFSSAGSELEFDLDNFDEIDEAETKLDLAAAYIDMGDPDGAKSILDEVITDGNDEQKSRAQDLLDSLS